MSQLTKLRIDKWLWAVRIFKTRGLANEFCLSGKVKIKGDRIKPSKQIQVGDIITIQKGMIKHVYKVTGLIEKRVSAPLAAENVEDLTPPEETQKITSAFAMKPLIRDRGKGRPTKKERRRMDQSRNKIR